MFRLLAVIIIIFLAGSFAGDILLIHHHLGSSSLEAEQITQMTILTAAVALLFVLKSMKISGLILIYCNRARKSFLRYFCGWNGSAYLEKQLVRC